MMDPKTELETVLQQYLPDCKLKIFHRFDYLSVIVTMGAKSLLFSVESHDAQGDPRSSNDLTMEIMQKVSDRWHTPVHSL